MRRVSADVAAVRGDEVDPIARDDPAATGGDPVRVLRLTIRLATAMLASGAGTEDVEAAIGAVTHGLGLRGVQASVTFSTISISWYASPASTPTTLVHLVHDRETEFSRLADMSGLARRLSRGELDVAAGEAELARLADRSQPYGPALTFVAPGISAAGATVMFGGAFADALATLAIALAVQPALAALDRSDLPPFFRLVFGSAASTILVAGLVGLGLPISGGLVLTGSLLRFLPGYALVSGFRDLIDGSIVSGTARLAEALLLGAAVAGGTALAISVATYADVDLSIQVSGATDWSFAITAIASLLAVGGFAIRLGVPVHALGGAAVLGAIGWIVYGSVTPPTGRIDPGIATLGASFLIGAAGRVLARRADAPTALWVVPAILPLLPGLQIVTAMLASTDLARLNGLVGAAGTAFLIGVGVATGDIVAVTVRRLRKAVVEPAVGAVAGGVDLLIVSPVERVVERMRPDGPEEAGGERGEGD
jgi:uncharacterized membrane protein YjjP (DUF1212 family)